MTRHSGPAGTLVFTERIESSTDSHKAKKSIIGAVSSQAASNAISHFGRWSH